MYDFALRIVYICNDVDIYCFVEILYIYLIEKLIQQDRIFLKKRGKYMDGVYESLAAVTVVRELYDTGKDIYDVLSNYLKLLIINEHMNDFSSAEITEKINRNNSFKLNESVVKTALKRLNINRNHGVYTVDVSFFDNEKINILDNQIKQNQLLLENLYEFIQSESSEILTEEKKETVQKRFYNYLLNEDTSDEYSLLISRYIMKTSIDDKYMSIINRIKEGSLIYEGICYSTDLSNLGKWTIELNIYLEQEILFYIAGYNGEIHKSLYQQLLDYIEEINSSNKSKKKYIKLYYTQDVKEEIEAYFRGAERAFEKGEIINPAKKPMLYILKDVKTKSDILTKKVQFYNLLNGRGILLKEFDFYSQENQQYSRVDTDVYQYNVDNIESDRGNDYIRKCTDKVNQIEILRQNHNVGLKDIKYILLTANGTILKCAYSKYAYQTGEVPKATILDFLLNKFWFELNKGFGKGVSPKTIDMVSRARMVLSLLTTNKISKAYDDIKNRYENGEVTQKEVAGIISELRIHSKTPDEINAENLAEDVSFLNDFDINRQIEELKREELAREADQEKIAFLESELEKMKKEKITVAEQQQKREEENENRIKTLEEKFNESKKENDSLNQKIQSFLERDERKKLIRKRVCRGSIFILCLVIIFIGFYFACSLLFKLDDSLSGLISIILTVLLAILNPIRKLWRKFVIDCDKK